MIVQQVVFACVISIAPILGAVVLYYSFKQDGRENNKQANSARG